MARQTSIGDARVAGWLSAATLMVVANACGDNGDAKPAANDAGNLASTATDGGTGGGAAAGTTVATNGGSIANTGGDRSATGGPNANSVTSSVGGSGGSAGAGGAESTNRGPGGTGNAAGGSAGESGCSSPEDCAATEYCDFPDDLCGTGEIGTCLPRPMGGSDGLPTCGCDGVIYTGPTIAIIQGVDTDALARCGDPFFEDAFWCGGYTCSDSNYCEITETPCGTRYDCSPLPSACEDCSCILQLQSMEPSDGQCSEDDMGVLTVRRAEQQCL